MKTKASEKNRVKLPKSKRLHSFFLRRLLICTAAAAVGGSVLLFWYYQRDKKNYRSNTSEFFSNRINSYTTYYSSEKTCKADKIMAEQGPQELITQLTNYLAYETGTVSPYSDLSAMLIDPENLEYYISGSKVTFIIRKPNGENEKSDSWLITADPELSGQIAAMQRNEARAQYPLLSAQYFADLFAEQVHFDVLSELLSRNRSLIEPLVLYTDGDTVRRLEYCWTNGYEDVEKTIVCGTDQTDGLEIIKNFKYSASADGYERVYDVDLNSITEPTVVAMTTYGFPADCESGKAMQELAAIFDARIKPDEIRQDILKYQEIIADQIGKKRDAYYEEQKQEIEELYGDAEDDPDAPDGYDYQSLFDNILSPEEQLQSIYSGFAETALQIADEQYDDHPFSGRNPEPFYTHDLLPIEIEGRTYYIFYFAHCEWLHDYLPYIIAIGIQILLGAAVLALIWSVIGYLRFRHRYEMDEYRRNLTASLAHDLKSPLMAVSSYSENLVNDVQPEKKQHYAQAIYENSQYMDDIISNVLELSELEKGGKPKRRKLDLTETAKMLLAAMQKELDARGLKASVSGSCTVKANPEMLTQAIRNLLDNAVKYTPEGGSITVTGENHTLSIVNDIAEEAVADPQRLSEAFVKGDKARSNRMGTGLGLSIVQQIAGQNRMKLLIESSEYQFRVRLVQSAPIRSLRGHKAK